MAEGKFMVAVGGIIEDSDSGKILLLKRSSKADFTPGIWEEVRLLSPSKLAIFLEALRWRRTSWY